MREVMAQTQEGSVEAPMSRDTFGMGIGALTDILGNINPNSTAPLFPMVSVDAPNLSVILQDAPEETRCQVT